MPEILRTRPTIGVVDVNASLALYVDALGFELVTTMGDAPDFALLSSPSGAGLALVRSESAPVTEFACCYIDVVGVDDTHDRCVAGGFAIANPLTDHPWNMRDFVVTDPTGNLVAVGESV